MICECIYVDPKHWWQKGQFNDSYCSMHNVENIRAEYRRNKIRALLEGGK